jgi:hypothetical protein
LGLKGLKRFDDNYYGNLRSIVLLIVLGSYGIAL